MSDQVATTKPGAVRAAPEAQRTEVLQYETPAVDLHHAAGEYLLEVEVPGVDKSGVEITVEDGRLAIIGHRKQALQSGKCLHREIAGGSYRRVFDLDPSLDPESVQADLEQGLLRIRLRKAKAHLPKKIKVN